VPSDGAARLDAAQRQSLGDMPARELRAALHEAADLVADYLAHIEDYAVLPPVQPGEIRRRLDGPPPEEPEPLDDILRDVREQVVPNVTHWQHPSYFAYFPASASGIGLLGEMVTSGLNANAFLWRTSPVGAELEAITVDWLRQGLGLPDSFDGVFNDTASISSLAALAAARQRATGNASQAGLRVSAPLRVYASAEAHSSIERAAMILGIGRDGVRKVAVDRDRAMDPDALRAAIVEDRAAGWLPSAVVATIGTTSTTAIDPVAAIADVCAADGLWLHVDAAYAGPTALIPEMRHHFVGWERAASIVVNPHKWMFTPFDCSLLLTREMGTLRDALSLVPEYLRTTDGRDTGRDYNEYIPQLGRRARGIKMWMQLRYFGLAGLRARLQLHLDLTAALAAWIDADPDFERLAPAPFGLVCFRWHPARLSGREAEPAVAAALDAANERLMNALNATGRIFLSHTRVDGRFTLRMAIGNIRTEPRHVEEAWELTRELAERLAGELDVPLTQATA
jgi:aromatic-L-amino-acid decarboxylase